MTQADACAQREPAKARINDACRALGNDGLEITLGADKDYDSKEFIGAREAMMGGPHVAQNKAGRNSAVTDEIVQTEGYVTSQHKWNLIERGFGWARTVGCMRQAMVRGLVRVDQMFVLTLAA